MVAALQKKIKTSKMGAETTATLLSEDDVLSEVKEFISTGFPGLDDILGGGWAVGRCSEVYGPEGAGKTALAQMAAKGCQAKGGIVFYLDFENALDPKRMKQLGLDPDLLVYVRPKHMEHAWDLVWEYVDHIKKNPPPAPTLILWDSLAATQTKGEAEEKSTESAHVAEAARILSKGCRRALTAIAQVRAHFMFINQERAKIGSFSPMGTPKGTYGGAAVKYSASQRVRCTRASTIKPSGNSGPAIGYLIKTKVDKNRCAPPHQAAVWVLDFRYGPSPDLTMRQVLMDAARIKSNGKVGRKSGYSLAWGEGPMKDRLKFTKGQWLTLLDADKAFRKDVTREYLEVVRAGGSKAVLEAAEAEALGEVNEDDEYEEIDPVVE